MKHEFVKGDIFYYNGDLRVFVNTGEVVVSDCFIVERIYDHYYGGIKPKKWKSIANNDYGHTGYLFLHEVFLVNYFKLENKEKVLQMLGSQDISVRQFCIDAIAAGTIK
jgi:hypothetical protein